MRNPQTVDEDSDIFHFAQVVDSFMDQFYSLKYFLIKLEILPPETNFAFNLSHVNFNKKKAKNYLKSDCNSEIWQRIMSYLPIEELLLFRATSK